MRSIREHVERILNADRGSPDCSSDTIVAYFYASHPLLRTSIGFKNDFGVITNGDAEGFLLFGPYMKMAKGAYIAQVFGYISRLDPSGACRFSFDATFDNGSKTNAKSSYGFEDIGYFTMSLPFALGEDVRDLELRVYSFQGAKARIAALRIIKDHSTAK